MTHVACKVAKLDVHVNQVGRVIDGIYKDERYPGKPNSTHRPSSLMPAGV